MSLVHTGRCACGTVRYETTGDPIRLSACHCKECQLRTGSAFGVGCYFLSTDVKVLGGNLQTYERSSGSGHWVKLQFCRACGTTVLWTFEAMLEATGIATGTFDDTDWIMPTLHVWAKSAQAWTHFPEDAEVFSESTLG